MGNGYGPTGCTQISDICGTSNPCVNGQCEVSVYLITSPLCSVSINPLQSACFYHRIQRLATSVAVTRAGQGRIVIRTWTSALAIPARTEAPAPTASTATPVPAPRSGPARSAKLHSKVCVIGDVMYVIVCVYLYSNIMDFYVRQSVEEFWKVQLAHSATLRILERAIMITRSAVHGSSEPTPARLVKIHQWPFKKIQSCIIYCTLN